MSSKKSSTKHKTRSVLADFENMHPLELTRPVPTRTEKEKILIFCEGKNTEPSYFGKFRLVSANIKILGAQKSKLKLVKNVLRYPNKDKYDQIWCVFDGDGADSSEFNPAVSLAEANNLKVAYSIQAFEYWLILHFEDHQGGGLHRDEYNAKLNHHLQTYKVVYDGEGRKLINEDFFELLDGIDPITKKQRIQLAIKRAKRIYKSFAPHHDLAKEESSTTVYRLVEEIQKYL